MDWLEIDIKIPAIEVEKASAIAHMVVPYGIYIEDYSDLMEQAPKIANIDLIDEDLIAKDRENAIIHIYIALDQNPSEAIAFLTERFESEQVPFTIQTTNMKEEDWEHNWKQYFKPFEIGEKLVIKPSWETYENTSNRKILEIDPGSSFGTGQHHTTQLCLEEIEQSMVAGSTVLDMGCGSGILSIACMLLGAKKVVAVDIDSNSVRITKENVAKNNMQSFDFTAYCGNITKEASLIKSIQMQKYDVIVANIVADVIIDMSPLFATFLNTGGLLIASGIISTRKEEVLSALKNHGFTIQHHQDRSDWIVVRAIRN